MEDVCDGVIDCTDKNDEKNCASGNNLLLNCSIDNVFIIIM